MIQLVKTRGLCFNVRKAEEHIAHSGTPCVDFEKLIVTVSYIIHCHNPKCKFITSYQERRYLW